MKKSFPKNVFLFLVFVLLNAAPLFADGLEVLQAAPTGEVEEIEYTSEIKIVFSKPMVPLARLAQSVQVPEVTVAPALAGEFRWSGTDTLLFKFAKRLPKATSFKVTVSGKMSAVSGDKLGDDYSFEFQTPRPRAVAMMPDDRRNEVSLIANVVLTFDQDVQVKGSGQILKLYAGPSIPKNKYDANKLNLSKYGEAPELKQKAEAYLDGLKNAEGKKTSVAFRVGYGHTNEVAIQNWKITGRGEKPVPEALDRRILVLEPLEKLSKSSTIFVEVKEGLQSVEGNLPGVAADFRFNTVHEFFVREVFGPDKVNPASPGAVEFSTEVSWADLKDGVFLNEMDPENPARVLRTLYHPDRKSKDIPRYYSSSLWFGNFNVRPSATYQLHILKGVTNRLGDPLPADFHYTFQTANFPQYLRTITGVSLQESYFPKKIRIQAMNLKTIQVGVADLDVTTIAGYAARHDRNDSFVRLKEVDLNARMNQPSQYDLVLGDKKDEDQIFYYEVKAGDDFPNSFAPKRQPLYKGLMQVTSLAVGCKAGYHEALVYVSDISNAEPLGEVNLTLVGKTSKETVWRGKTDAKGFAVIPGWKNVSNVYDVLIYAEKGKRRGYLDGSFTRDLGTWSFNIEQNTTDSPDKQPGYLITDRGVYKQGDPVFVKGIIRSITNEIFAAPGNLPVLVTVDDRSGTAVYSNRLSLSEFGGFDFRFEIPKEGELGDYQIRAEVGDESYNASVYVAQYRAPVFRNTVGNDGGVKILGDKARFTVKGEYLFGAPLKKGEVKWFFTSSASAFTPSLPLKDDTADKWSFRHNVKYLDEKEKDIPHPQPASGSGELADDGGFQITLPLDHKTWLEPRTYQFEAEVVSLDKQAVASRTAVLVHPSQWYLGLRRDNYFVDTGKVFSTKVFCLTPSGEPVDGQQISLKLTKRSWKSTKKKAFDQSYYAETEAYDELVNTQNVASKKDPLVVSFTVTNGGYYILRAEGKDSRGNPVLSSYDFYAIGKGYSTWALGDSDTVELIPEQSSVRPGAPLRVLIKSPFEKCKALLTIERGKVLESRWLDLVGSMPVVEIPVRREHIPNFFVSVVLMKGRETFEVTPDFIDKGVPVVKLGYASISVIPDEARLTVDLRSDKKIYEPGEWVNLKVRASANDKKGERSEIALFAVDEAVLSLTGYEPPDPLQYFYGNRPMGVTTLDSRPFVIHQRYFGSKGASPGGGGGGGPDIKLRSDFQTTPFWQGALVTGADGSGEAKFKLPDNLTTFKIFAVAAGTARFGKAVNAVTVKKDFMLMPSFPRFAMRGDTFYAAVTAHNLTKKSGTVELSLAADEKSKALGDVSSIKFMLAAESSTNLRVGFRADLDGTSTFKVQGKINFGSESKTDGFVQKVPIHLPVITESAAAYGTLRENDDRRVEKIELPQKVYDGVGGLSVEFSSTLLEDLELPLKYLADYPYGCVEQTSSRLFSALLRYRLNKDFGFVSGPGLTAETYRNDIEKILKYLASFQRDDGGLSFWPDSSYTRSYPWGTGYAVLVLAEAKRQGFQMKTGFLENAISYLKTQMKSSTEESYYGLTFSVATKVHILHALARHGTFDASFYEYLSSKQNDMSLFARAEFLELLSRHRANGGRSLDKLISGVKAQIMNQAVIEGGYVLFQQKGFRGMEALLESEDRGTAMALSALLAEDPKNALAPRIMTGLNKNRKNGRWRNTQENAYVCQAILDYYLAVEKDTPNFQAASTLGKRAVLETNYSGRTFARAKTELNLGELKKVFDGEKPDKGMLDLAFTKKGSGVLYYKARLSYAPLPESFLPLSKGMTLSKKYLLASTGKEATRFKTGDLVKVVLSYSSPSARSFVVIDDPIPAGMEILDERMATTAQARTEGDSVAEESSGWFRSGFSRKDVYDHKLVVFADELPAGDQVFVYTARVTTPGRFVAAAAKTEAMYFPEIFGTASPVSVQVDE